MKRFILLAFSLYSAIVFSQQTSPDSLLLEHQLAMERHDTTNLAGISYALGKFYFGISHYELADKYYKEAVDYNRLLKDSSKLSWSLRNLGMTNKYWGKYEMALEYCQEALDIFIKQNNESGVAYTNLVLGYIYEAWEDYEQSHSYCLQSKMYFEQNGIKEGLAYSYLALGNSELHFGNYERANAHYNKALNLFTELESEIGCLLTYRDLGNFYMQTKEFNEAELYLNRSLQIAQKIKDNRSIAKQMMLLGKLYTQQSKIAEAKQYYEESLKLAKEIQLQEEVIKIYEEVAEFNTLIGEYEKAYRYHKKYTHLKDSIFNKDKHRQISEMQTKYETKQKEQQIVLKDLQLKQANSENKKKNLLLILSLAIIVIIVVFALLLWSQYKQKVQANTILNIQKEEIIAQNEMVAKQRDLISKQNKNIIDSIKYAKNIQNALLPNNEFINLVLIDYFILFKPRDIVSGDFYWIEKAGDNAIIAVADCTGHGVPGAFMSMLGSSFLTEIVTRTNTFSPGEILNRLRDKVKNALKQEGKKGEQKDGMDIALYFINYAKLELQYAGAYNPLYIVRQNGSSPQFIEMKANRQPIAIYFDEHEFETQTIQLEKGDVLYSFTDGYYDQFGGKKGGKFLAKNFKNLLLSIAHMPLQEQAQLLEQNFINWRGDYDQIDDVLVLGIRV